MALNLYRVFGTRHVAVELEVEAESAADAYQLAGDSDPDIWLDLDAEWVEIDGVEDIEP